VATELIALLQRTLEILLGRPGFIVAGTLPGSTAQPCGLFPYRISACCVCV